MRLSSLAHQILSGPRCAGTMRTLCEPENTFGAWWSWQPNNGSSWSGSIQIGRQTWLTFMHRTWQIGAWLSDASQVSVVRQPIMLLGFKEKWYKHYYVQFEIEGSNSTLFYFFGKELIPNSNLYNMLCFQNKLRISLISKSLSWNFEIERKFWFDLGFALILCATRNWGKILKNMGFLHKNITQNLRMLQLLCFVMVDVGI